ncbi:MAG: hypothetical protein ACFB13_24620 [Kiloniellaceae bacterium]
MPLQKSRKSNCRWQVSGRWLALVGSLTLAACAAAPAGGGRYVENPAAWKTIDLAEADMTLPLVTPIEIASLERQEHGSQERREIYTFQGVEGYVKTTRRIAGAYPETYVQSLKAGYAARPYIAQLSLPSADRIKTQVNWAFLNGKSLDGKFLSRGFTAEGAAPPRYDNCFVARTAYLMVDLEAIKRTPDAVDTVVEVLLCGNRGDLPPYNDMVKMLAQIDVVADRDTFRQELADRTAGNT